MKKEAIMFGFLSQMQIHGSQEKFVQKKYNIKGKFFCLVHKKPIF